MAQSRMSSHFLPTLGLPRPLRETFAPDDEPPKPRPAKRRRIDPNGEVGEDEKFEEDSLPHIFSCGILHMYNRADYLAIELYDSNQRLREQIRQSRECAMKKMRQLDREINRIIQHDKKEGKKRSHDRLWKLALDGRDAQLVATFKEEMTRLAQLLATEGNQCAINEFLFADIFCSLAGALIGAEFEAKPKTPGEVFANARLKYLRAWYPVDHFLRDVFGQLEELFPTEDFHTFEEHESCKGCHSFIQSEKCRYQNLICRVAARVQKVERTYSKRVWQQALEPQSQQSHGQMPVVVDQHQQPVTIRIKLLYQD